MEAREQLILVTGGARSGKSTFAERLAAHMSQPPLGGCGRQRQVVLLATSETNDAEMAARVAAHRAARPAAWLTVECPLEAPAAVREHACASGDVVFLLDCVTFWVSNLLFAGGDLGGTAPGDDFNYDKSLLTRAQEEGATARVTVAVAELLAAVADTGVTLISVSNEVGLGVVPEYPLARLYRDQLGWANQRLAAAADRVYFLVAGVPLDLKRLASSTSPHHTP